MADGPVAELTAASRELDLRLSRRLESAEVDRVKELPGVAFVKTDNAPDYAIGFASSEGNDWDGAVAGVLRELLDLGVVPRRLHEGQSLERHFLAVTGSSGTERPDG